MTSAHLPAVFAVVAVASLAPADVLALRVDTARRFQTIDNFGASGAWVMLGGVRTIGDARMAGGALCPWPMVLFLSGGWAPLGPVTR